MKQYWISSIGIALLLATAIGVIFTAGFFVQKMDDTIKETRVMLNETTGIKFDIKNLSIDVKNLSKRFDDLESRMIDLTIEVRDGNRRLTKVEEKQKEQK